MTLDPDTLLPAAIDWLLEQYDAGAVTTRSLTDPVATWRNALVQESIRRYAHRQEEERSEKPAEADEKAGHARQARAYILRQMEAGQPIDRAALLAVTGWSDAGINNFVQHVQEQAEHAGR